METEVLPRHCTVLPCAPASTRLCPLLCTVCQMQAARWVTSVGSVGLGALFTSKTLNIIYTRILHENMRVTIEATVGTRIHKHVSSWGGAGLAIRWSSCGSPLRGLQLTAVCAHLCLSVWLPLSRVSLEGFPQRTRRSLPRNCSPTCQSVTNQRRLSGKCSSTTHLRRCRQCRCPLFLREKTALPRPRQVSGASASHVCGLFLLLSLPPCPMRITPLAVVLACMWAIPPTRSCPRAHSSPRYGPHVQSMWAIPPTRSWPRAYLFLRRGPRVQSMCICRRNALGALTSWPPMLTLGLLCYGCGCVQELARRWVSSSRPLRSYAVCLKEGRLC